MNIKHINKKARLTSYVKQMYNCLTRLDQKYQKKTSSYRAKEESKMYELEIETRDKIFRVGNPKAAKASKHFFFFSIRIKDGRGFWHTIGHCKLLKDAEGLVKKLNDAIIREDDTVYLSI